MAFLCGRDFFSIISINAEEVNVLLCNVQDDNELSLYDIQFTVSWIIQSEQMSV